MKHGEGGLATGRPFALLARANGEGQRREPAALGFGRPAGSAACPTNPPSSAVRAATLVDPKAKKNRSRSRTTTRGDDLFESKKDAKASLDEDALAINDLQDAMFACKAGALLVVMQGIDTSGKDGTTKEALQLHQPARRQRLRLRQADRRRAGARLSLAPAPARAAKGYIHVFNRSQYEDVLVVKVASLPRRSRSSSATSRSTPSRSCWPRTARAC